MPLSDRVTSLARGCRMRRQELSLILVAIDRSNGMQHPERSKTAKLAGQVLRATCRDLTPGEGVLEAVTTTHVALILPDCDRCQATSIANLVVNRLDRLSKTEQLAPIWESMAVNIGAATATNVVKNFESSRLLDGAQRCLEAARSCTGSAVKSIEIY